MPEASHKAETSELLKLAESLLPAGTMGNFNAGLVIREGRGGRVWDTDGKEYIDLLLGSGPMMLGHAHPKVTEAVSEQLKRGSTFAANNEFAILLAKEIVAAVPCAEQVRYVSSGSEADAYAMRLARAYRRKPKILKFEGGYHGMSDYGLMSIWPNAAANSERPVPDSGGIPESVRGDMIVAPYNDLAATRELFARYKDELAAVIVEPLQRVIPPAPGFLQGLRDLCDEYDVTLIFDEVVTGFRLAYGGAQAYYGVVPDLCTLGKLVGGGYPLAAIAGKAEIMAHLDARKVAREDYLPQIGTLSGNPIAAIAGLTTLELLRQPGLYDELHATGEALAEAMRDALTEQGFTVLILGEPVMFDAVFTAARNIHDYRGMLGIDMAKSTRYASLLGKHGVLKSDNKAYISVCHKNDLDDARTAFRAAAKDLAIQA